MGISTVPGRAYPAGFCFENQAAGYDSNAGASAFPPPCMALGPADQTTQPIIAKK